MGTTHTSEFNNLYIKLLYNETLWGIRYIYNIYSLHGSHTLALARTGLRVSPALVGHEYYASVYIRGTSNSVLIWISLDLFTGARSKMHDSTTYTRIHNILQKQKSTARGGNLYVFYIANAYINALQGFEIDNA
jgi:hypothetical protein